MRTTAVTIASAGVLPLAPRMRSPLGRSRPVQATTESRSRGRCD